MIASSNNYNIFFLGIVMSVVMITAMTISCRIQGERDRCYEELDETIHRNGGCGGVIIFENGINMSKQSGNSPGWLVPMRDYQIIRCLMELQEAERCEKKLNTPALNFSAAGNQLY